MWHSKPVEHIEDVAVPGSKKSAAQLSSTHHPTHLHPSPLYSRVVEKPLTSSCWSACPPLYRRRGTGTGGIGKWNETRANHNKNEG